MSSHEVSYLIIHASSADMLESFFFNLGVLKISSNNFFIETDNHNCFLKFASIFLSYCGLCSVKTFAYVYF